MQLDERIDDVLQSARRHQGGTRTRPNALYQPVQ